MHYLQNETLFMITYFNLKNVEYNGLTNIMYFIINAVCQLPSLGDFYRNLKLMLSTLKISYFTGALTISNTNYISLIRR